MKAQKAKMKGNEGPEGQNEKMNVQKAQKPKNDRRHGTDAIFKERPGNFRGAPTGQSPKAKNDRQ